MGEEKVCVGCGTATAHVYGVVDTGEPRCLKCWEKFRDREKVAAQASRILLNFDKVLADYLRQSGMSPRELAAELELVPRPIVDVFPRTAAQLLNGELPATGFGLSGMVGHGKTCAMAALVKAYASKMLRRSIEEEGADGLRPTILWLDWPGTVDELRVRSMRDAGIADVAERVRLAWEADLLVLDDVGAERIPKGSSYAEDWAVSQLDLIVNTRYRWNRATWYTTTLTDVRLAGHFGARMFSRLCGENPLVTVPQGRDLRLRGRS